MADEEVGLLDQHSAAAEATAPAATELRAAPPATRAAATPYDAIRLYLKTRGFNQAWLTKVRRNLFFVTVGRRRPKSGHRSMRTPQHRERIFRATLMIAST